MNLPLYSISNVNVAPLVSESPIFGNKMKYSLKLSL